MAYLFGLLGAVAAALYWRYAVFAGPSLLAIHWTPDGRAVLMYVAVGFVVGCVVGIAFTMMSSDKNW